MMLAAGGWMLGAWRIRARFVGLLLVIPSAHSEHSARSASAEAVLAGGCFWGVEAVFEHVRGVKSVTSGFAQFGDAVPVEAVRIVYDPSQVEYRRLLEVFFAVAHDPTSRDRQGPDVGPEYRAAVLYQSAAEREAAKAFMAELNRSGRFTQPIVTELRKLSAFTIAAAFHQDYGVRHPDDPYIVRNDAPKLVLLKERFPTLYQERRAP